MKYNIVDGDITLANETVICHQVNCQGKMGSGVAKAIRTKYPKVYDEYTKFIADNKVNSRSDTLLGKVQFVEVRDSLGPKYVANLFAQDNYGYDGKQYTSLEAFQNCIRKLNTCCVGCTMAFPWKIGSVRGGASWDTILSIIETYLTDVKSITFYRLDAK